MEFSRRATLVNGLALASSIAVSALAEPPPTREELFKLLFQEDILGPVDPVPGDPLWEKADRIIDAAPRKGPPYRVADYFATDASIPLKFRRAWKEEKLANPVIVDFWKKLGIGRPDPGGDKVAWCAVFANWCLDRVHMTGTGNARAQSFLNWGNPVWQRNDGVDALSAARPGDIAVFRNAINSSRGHVAFFLGLDATRSNHMMIVGGNYRERIGRDSVQIVGGDQPLLTVLTAKGLRDA